MRSYQWHTKKLQFVLQTKHIPICIINIARLILFTEVTGTQNTVRIIRNIPIDCGSNENIFAVTTVDTNCISLVMKNQIRKCISNKLTIKMQQFYKFITWLFVSLNMFRAPPRPSSGAYNFINSLWFLPWSMVVAALLVVV